MSKNNSATSTDIIDDTTNQNQTPEELADEAFAHDDFTLVLDGTALDAFNYVFTRTYAPQIAMRGSKALGGLREMFVKDLFVKTIKSLGNAQYTRDYTIEKNLTPSEAKALPKQFR